MARRMKSKIQPAVHTLTFSTATVSTEQTKDFYIDLSQCASLVNRRFYRQGLNWAVSSIKILSGGFQGSVIVQSLPNTWVMSNAWEKSFRTWQHMIKNATDDAGSESIKGKFLDFKIFADSGHHTAGVGANLLPIDANIDTFNTGQWQMSDITIPATSGHATTDFELIAVGPNDPGAGASGKDAKSVIQGYADSRALPNIEDPNVPADASLNWMMSIFNEGTLQDNAVTNMLEVTGDKAPYPFENDGINNDTMYPGGETQAPTMQIHDYNLITATTVGAESISKGGNFPCGLIKFTCTNTTETAHNLVFQVNLVPGNHRGYLAESMTEM